MARYRKVDPRIWGDEKFLRLPERAKLIFLYLLTNPSMTMLGAMRGSSSGMAEEVGVEVDEFRDAFQRIVDAGMVRFDQRARFVWLPKFLRYNRPESPNVVKAWPAAFAMLPECKLRDDLLKQLRVFAEGLPEGFRDAFMDVFDNGMPTQEQEQEQEQEAGTGTGTGAIARNRNSRNRNMNSNRARENTKVGEKQPPANCRCGAPLETIVERTTGRCVNCLSEERQLAEAY
jgi:hypothetical protein